MAGPKLSIKRFHCISLIATSRIMRGNEVVGYNMGFGKESRYLTAATYSAIKLGA